MSLHKRFVQCYELLQCLVGFLEGKKGWVGLGWVKMKK